MRLVHWPSRGSWIWRQRAGLVAFLKNRGEIHITCNLPFESVHFSGIYDSIFIMGHHQLFLLSKLKFDFKEGQMMEFGYRKWSHSDPDLEQWFGFSKPQVL